MTVTDQFKEFQVFMAHPGLTHIKQGAQLCHPLVI